MSSHAKLPGVNEEHLEPEEDEEEDVDFNPFLREALSPEASSSLSSENEGLGSDFGNVGSSSKGTNLSSNFTNELQNNVNKDMENNGEEVVMQPPGCTSENDSEDVCMHKGKKRISLSASQTEFGSTDVEGCCGCTEFLPGKENNSSGGTDVEVVNEGEPPQSRYLGKSTMYLDDEEDAICRRTRARYSLANFTLEELETFLQESGDDDEFQNADDEQEYRKFLAAVLQGGDDEGQTLQENATAEDTDEDNDADFELEIEEALDSDLDESMRGKRQKGKYGVEGRRPETRQNKRQKTSVQNKKKISGQANRPLRPLLPSVPKAQLAPFPTLDWQKLTPDNSYNSSYPNQGSSINGFTPNQIGQLHCLIHEHVQLLVQVFSLCVLDHSRQHIAGEIQKMISEVVYKRDEVSSRRKMPYPGYCFHPRCIQPSVSEELPEFQHVHGIVESSSATPNPLRDCSSVSDVPIAHYSHPSGGENNYDAHSTHLDSLHITKGSSWMPLINGPVFSILDVAPLNLVQRYIADASRAAEQYRQRFTELDFGHHFEKEPLFPLPNLSAFAEASNEVVRGAPSAGTGTVSSALPGNRQPKKTLAATLVESTKKQSVALVPKEIVKLAQRFYPLFNSALFPHKPPPATVVNRVLFTDAEDELLAMGLMECNTDWKAIQQRFLPCKSKHQIFVRQKNRCSSKAPENSIKAVRKMKTSPLTEEEMARIHEGLRILKLDWMSVWKYIVPYRDPSLLPRQWRIANGTQKSYKTDPAKKEKRRKYESERRKSKGAALANWQSPSEKEDYQVRNADEENKSGNDNMEDENEAYVHEAFLSDWRPVNSGFPSSELALSLNSLQPGGILPQEGACMGENLRYGESPPISGYVHESLAASEFSQHPSHVTRVRYSASYNLTSNQFSPDWVSKSSKSQVSLRPYRRRRSKDSQLVKLAPDLPPVNLPPSVRVISQSAFRSYHCGSSNSTKATSGGVGGEIVAPVASGTTVDVGKRRHTFSCHDTANTCPQGSRLRTNQCTAGGKDSESDLQMHPLLFQASEDGPSTYDRMDCSTSATFNFLPANQLQANSSLLSKARELDTPIDHFYTSLRSNEIPSSTCTIDFHPLLQKVDNVNSYPPIISPDYQVPPELGSFGRKYIQLRNPSDLVMAEQVSNGPRSVELASTYEKANELDLDIHLSNTSRKGKVMRSGALTEHSSNHSETELVGGRTSKDSQRLYNPSFHIGNCSPEATFATGNNIHVLGAQATVLASDQSHPGIVMEQEELSDSEEEVGEHVEFECEEMTDSEGDNSDYGQHPDTQYKEVAEITTEGNIAIGETKSRQGEPTTYNSVEGTLLATTNSNTSSSTRRLAGKGKDTTRSRTNKLQVSNGVSPIGKSSSSRPSRLCKKTAPSTKAISTEKSKSSRKPRSRVYRKDAAGNFDYVNSGGFPRNDDSSKVEDDPTKATEAKKECTELGLKS